MSIVCWQVEALRRADPSYREILPSVCVCMCVIEFDQVQQEPSAPTRRWYKSIRLRKKEWKEENSEKYKPIAGLRHNTAY
jgi:hypothetical protein